MTTRDDLMGLRMRADKTRVGIIAACLLGLSACSGGASTGSPSRSLPTSASTAPVTASSRTGETASTSDAAADPRAVALTTYRAMWADMVEAGKTADYQSPTLAHHAAGQALQLLVSGLYDAHKGNVVIKGEPALNPQATGVTSAERVLRKCMNAECCYGLAEVGSGPVMVRQCRQRVPPASPVFRTWTKLGWSGRVWLMLHRWVA
jgi:hypothetical protein